ncbi:MAG TPA: GNAT family N-acetyltransferase [Gammaproteobacteria bacterium]|nr:GNAT family N-acetyltransferase [Gammaproteobacteria bacterium]
MQPTGRELTDGWLITLGRMEKTSRSFEVETAAFPAVDSYLADRIYEFNVEATQLPDAKEFALVVRDKSQEVIAGISGHRWGGTCHINHLWVHQEHRKSGLGTALIKEAEAEARKAKCSQVLLSSHSFQAPGFYEKMGYHLVAVITDYPNGHSNQHFMKILYTSDAA